MNKKSKTPAPAGLVSKAAFCRALRIHPATFTDWMERGYLDTVRIGHRLYVSEDEMANVISGAKRWIKKSGAQK